MISIENILATLTVTWSISWYFFYNNFKMLLKDYVLQVARIIIFKFPNVTPLGEVLGRSKSETQRSSRSNI